VAAVTDERRARSAGRCLYREPLDRAGRRGFPARELGASGPSDAHEVSLARLEAELHDGGRGRPADREEPLSIAALGATVEVAVRVRAVEEAPRDVVDAEVEPRAGAAAAEIGTGASDPLVGRLPVNEEAIGVDHERGDAILAVSPGDVFLGFAR